MIKSCIVISLLFWLVGGINGFATEPEAQEQKPFDYQSELTRLKSGDTSVDFTKLRFAFAKSKKASPLTINENDIRKEAIKALNAGDIEKALELAHKILAFDYFYSDAHMIAMVAEDALHHDDKAAFHRDVLNGLFDSICKGDQGTSESKPCKVISVDEEYFVLQALGLRFKKQALIRCSGKPCDRMTATDPESGKEIDMYFDVSIPFAKYSE